MGTGRLPTATEAVTHLSRETDSALSFQATPTGIPSALIHHRTIDDVADDNSPCDTRTKGPTAIATVGSRMPEAGSPASHLMGLCD